MAAGTFGHVGLHESAAALASGLAGSSTGFESAYARPDR